MELKELVTETAFIKTFWNELSSRRLQGSNCTHKEVFDYLNEIYEEQTGEPRFPSFDAFRKCRDRKMRKAYARGRK